MSYMYIFLGGGIGSLLRHLVGIFTLRFTNITWLGTLIVNVVGSLLLIILFRESENSLKNYEPLIKIGFLGALTTFSTFSFNIFDLIKLGRFGEASLCFSLNIFFGILIGIWMFR